MAQILPPKAYVNDGTGQVYHTIVTNSGTAPAACLSVAFDVETGFFYSGGSLSNDRSLPTTVSGIDPFTVSFPGGFDLETGGSITLTYRLGTTCDALFGRNPLGVTALFAGGTAQDISLAVVTTGLISVDLSPVSPVPFEAAVGDTLVLVATITNNGQGSVFGVDFSTQWGDDLTSPILSGGDILPAQIGNTFQATVSELKAGESRSFQFTLVVAGCPDLAADVQGSEPCKPGTVFSDDRSPFLILKQPNIVITPTDAAIS